MAIFTLSHEIKEIQIKYATNKAYYKYEYIQVSETH